MSSLSLFQGMRISLEQDIFMRLVMQKALGDVNALLFSAQFDKIDKEKAKTPRKEDV